LADNFTQSDKMEIETKEARPPAGFFIVQEPIMPTVRLCAEILPTGSQCRQFALKGHPWCHAHYQPYRRELNADTREIVAMIPAMDLFTVTLMLANTVHTLRTKETPPLHAQAIFDASAARLERLLEEQALAALQNANPVRSGNSQQQNRLQVVPMK
jgi:hypothetical protein